MSNKPLKPDIAHCRAGMAVGNHLTQMELTWDVIEAATGLTEAKFQDFKTRLSGSDPQNSC